MRPSATRIHSHWGGTSRPTFSPLPLDTHEWVVKPSFLEYRGFDPPALINANPLLFLNLCKPAPRRFRSAREATGRERLDKCPGFLLSEHDKRPCRSQPRFLFFSLPPCLSLSLFPFLWLNSIKRIPESVLSYHGLEKLRRRMVSEEERFFSFLVKGNTLELIRRFSLFSQPSFLMLYGGGSFLRCG